MSFKTHPLRCTDDPWLANRAGFSLIELLAVIGIISILLGLLFPAASAVRQAARRAVCLSNVRQVITATLSYEANGFGFPTADNGKGGSFIVPILNHLEQPELYERSELSLSSDQRYSDRWENLSNVAIPVLLCPASDNTEELAELDSQGTFTTHYYGIAGPVGNDDGELGSSLDYKELLPRPLAGPIGLQGLFSPNVAGKFTPRHYRDISDGASNTLAFGEIAGTPPRTARDFQDRNGWAFGAGYNSSGKVIEIYGCKTVADSINMQATKLNSVPFRSNHPGGAQFALADGSTQFIDIAIDLNIFKVMSSINGGEPTSFSAF